MSRFPAFCLFLCLLSGIVWSQPSTGKVQTIVDNLKKLYSNENRDYITDGERIVWVKSYRKWSPADLATLKKENPAALQFLVKLCTHPRFDILDQLMPEYYRRNGGVRSFAADIMSLETEGKTGLHIPATPSVRTASHVRLYSKTNYLFTIQYSFSA